MAVIQVLGRLRKERSVDRRLVEYVCVFHKPGTEKKKETEKEAKEVWSEGRREMCRAIEGMVFQNKTLDSH